MKTNQKYQYSTPYIPGVGYALYSIILNRAISRRHL